MTDMLEFTILTDGPKNGEKTYLRAEDIRRVWPYETRTESVHILGQTKMVQGSVLFLNVQSGPPSQTVQETPPEIVAALGGAKKVANLTLRNANKKGA